MVRVFIITPHLQNCKTSQFGNKPIAEQSGVFAITPTKNTARPPLKSVFYVKKRFCNHTNI